MDKSNKSLPATKADVNQVKTELKGDISNVRTELKKDIANVRTELKQDISNVRTELKQDISNVRTELKQDISNVRTELKKDISGVVGEIVKLDIRITKIEENMATKDDINRILNIMDSFINEIRDYRTKDILRAETIMEHDKKIKDHETRLQKLELR
jgi:F0F1-type ATP synthase membrane subunit b/b'